MKIGIFDSGLGGLTVLSGINEKISEQELIYLSDNERAPYGDKSDEDIKKYTYEMIDFLLDKKIELLIIACNTITSFLLEEIKNRTNIKVIGVIEPAIKEAVEKTKSKNILLLATTKTVNTEIYEKEIKKYDKEINLISKKCPSFVPMIEEGSIDIKKINEELESVKNLNFDTVILGCTHYPYIKKEIKQILNKKIEFADSVYNIIEELKKEQKINFNEGKNKINLYTTGNLENYEKKVKELFLDENYYIEKIEIKVY